MIDLPQHFLVWGENLAVTAAGAAPMRHSRCRSISVANRRLALPFELDGRKFQETEQRRCLCTGWVDPHKSTQSRGLARNGALSHDSAKIMH